MCVGIVLIDILVPNLAPKEKIPASTLPACTELKPFPRPY